MAMPHRLSTEVESPTSPQAPQEAPDIDALAESIKRSGMAGVASILLHATRPLAWLGGQMLWAVQPFAGIFGGRQAPHSLGGIATMLEREDFPDDLAERLDRPAADRDAKL